MASCKWPIALLIADFDQKKAKLHRKFKRPFPAKLLWVNVSKRILTLRNVGIAVFFGHSIDSVGCLFCLFLPWLFSPFFLSVGSFFQASGSSARHVFLVLYYMRNFFNLIG